MLKQNDNQIMRQLRESELDEESIPLELDVLPPRSGANSPFPFSRHHRSTDGIESDNVLFE